MARPTLSSHPKFAKLSARLGSRALARGVLELVWESCYASGDAVVGDAEAVEALVDWSGARGELAEALVACGFLDLQTDASEEHPNANGGQVQHYVHDLEDHAPDYVLKRWEREAKRREAGQTIRSLRQEAARVRWKHRAMQVSAVVLPPAPAPAPTRERDRIGPVARPPSNERPARRPTPVGLVTPDFLAVYDRYPNKNGRLRAADVFDELAGEYESGTQGLREEILAAFASGMLDRHPYSGEQRFRPSLETFLSERRWLDANSQPDDEPTPVSTKAVRDSAAATNRKLAELRSFESKGATAEELAELRQHREASGT